VCVFVKERGILKMFHDIRMLILGFPTEDGFEF
jgi:hypothetical protein